MMTDEDIMISAKAVFAKEPVAQASKHYTFIPTTELIADFRKLGWHVERANQQKSKDPMHTKHKVVFRSDAFPAINGVFPELIVTNSHDRTAAFVFLLGLFRLVCANGLVVADKVFEELRIRHIRYNFESLKELTHTMMENMPSVMQSIVRLERVVLTPDQQMEFAVKAIASRFKEYVNDRNIINIAEIEKAVNLPAFIQPVRPEDSNDSVWAVYNRIQEKLVNGGFQRVGLVDDISKRVRPITNIKLDIDVNKSLWQLATEYAEAGA
jgi:hypothetical protein